MSCISPLEGYKDPHSGALVFKRPAVAVPEEMSVACGYCIGCRLDYSCMWAVRIVHESAMHEYSGGNCFVTLTYREKLDCDLEQLRAGYHVPDDWSLQKHHFQLFMKRLRKHFAPRKIRFFHCGEYGSICKHGLDLDVVSCPMCNVGRPHYHCALFGVTFDDLRAYKPDGLGDYYYTSPTLEDIWKYGFVDVGELNFNSASYVARYILKKITGDKADHWYMDFDEYGVVTFLTPEYMTCSRRPGIGSAFYDKYKSDFFPLDRSPVPGHGVIQKVPRYYDDKLRVQDPDLFAKVQEMREVFLREHADEYTPDRLRQKYHCLKSKVKDMERRL